VNPIYSILESSHRWLILAGISFTAACVGAIAMLAYGWSHTLDRAWFYAGAILALYFLIRAFMSWTETVRSASSNELTRRRPLAEQEPDQQLD
jgi:hypothetical protein